MKLYVINSDNKKVYLNLVAPTREDLKTLIGGENFFLSDNLYTIYDVRAENDSNRTTTGAVVGGIVGALGGPIGIIIGGFMGGLIGNNSDEEENEKVSCFNKS